MLHIRLRMTRNWLIVCPVLAPDLLLTAAGNTGRHWATVATGADAWRHTV
jgi:hypothetical protein